MIEFVNLIWSVFIILHYTVMKIAPASLGIRPLKGFDGKTNILRRHPVFPENPQPQLELQKTLPRRTMVEKEQPRKNMQPQMPIMPQMPMQSQMSMQQQMLMQQQMPMQYQQQNLLRMNPLMQQMPTQPQSNSQGSIGIQPQMMSMQQQMQNQMLGQMQPQWMMPPQEYMEMPLRLGMRSSPKSPTTSTWPPYVGGNTPKPNPFANVSICPENARCRDNYF